MQGLCDFLQSQLLNVIALLFVEMNIHNKRLINVNQIKMSKFYDVIVLLRCHKLSGFQRMEFD